MIFLTGGTGFVGSYLTRALAERGYKVRCLARRSSAIKHLEGLGFEVILGDIRDPASLEGAFKDIDVIIHLAAIVEGRRQELEAVNWKGTANIVAAAKAAGVNRIIHMSSLGASPNKKYPYAFSIWKGEGEVKKLDYIILRPSIIFGQGDKFITGLVRIIKNSPIIPIIGSGRTKLQPIWVEDVIRCILVILKSERFSKEIIPLGGAEILSYEEIINELIKILGVKRIKLRVPRRATRFIVKNLKRLGINIPFVPGHFLGQDNIAGLGIMEKRFGFSPQGLRELLHLTCVQF